VLNTNPQVGPNMSQGKATGVIVTSHHVMTWHVYYVEHLGLLLRHQASYSHTTWSKRSISIIIEKDVQRCKYIDSLSAKIQLFFYWNQYNDKASLMYVYCFFRWKAEENNQINLNNNYSLCSSWNWRIALMTYYYIWKY